MNEVLHDRTQHTNRLIHETSPYLLQHAHNPVDWYPWSDEAFERARTESKPVFLSIGYSACHWCHVMEGESFENEAVAAFLNEHFVSIKVDREERPDLDDVYMTAVQVLSGSGGWPMSVFLTPEKKPFYAGTYFPPRDMYGRPGFMTVLRSVAEAWDRNPDGILKSAEEITLAVKRAVERDAQGREPISAEVLEMATRELSVTFDLEEGGFTPAPKFPPPHALAFLLRRYLRTQQQSAIGMCMLTLDKMALGGIYDHIGGGFHRYSTDERWLVPHFEKMLYDNAQLVSVYLEAFQATGSTLYAQVARETLDYVLRDLSTPEGGFCSSEDADSEGKEGTFYLWSRKGIDEVLGKEDANVFCTLYNITEDGNFASHESYHRGLNIPHRTEATLSEEDLQTLITEMKARLFSARNHRTRPGRDDKILTSWNALMISAFARGAQILQEQQYLVATQKAAGFLLDQMLDKGILHHSFRSGQRRVRGILDDYAFLVAALIDLYEADFNPVWLERAVQIADTMILEFSEGAHPGFLLSPKSETGLIARARPFHDGAEPSGNAVAVHALLRLGILLDRDDYWKRGKDIIESVWTDMKRMPQAFFRMLSAADYLLAKRSEVVIVGNPTDPRTHSLLAVLRQSFLPHTIVALKDPENGSSAEVRIPLLRGKSTVDGKPAAYVCTGSACRTPVTTPESLHNLLEELREGYDS